MLHILVEEFTCTVISKDVMVAASVMVGISLFLTVSHILLVVISALKICLSVCDNITVTSIKVFV